MTANETSNDPGSATAGRQIEITADEDWKSRVRAENAAIEQKFHADEPATAKTAAEGPTPVADEKPSKPTETASREPQASRERSELPPLPEASLAALLGMLSNQAMVALGLIRNPATGKAEKELPIARYFIDLISVLEQKTQGNLDPDEAAALDETLHTLRMAFVHRSKDTA
jgi:hypothetical protein